MSRYFIKLAYNGTNYNGWQVQENTPNTIQQVLEEKLTMLLKEPIEVMGCGRTDTGVHARNYFAHFNCLNTDLTENSEHWVYKLNNVLPPDISIFFIQKAKEDAHARFDAITRTYHYYLHQHKNPFLENFSWHQYGEIDFELMNKAKSPATGGPASPAARSSCRAFFWTTTANPPSQAAPLRARCG